MKLFIGLLTLIIAGAKAGYIGGYSSGHHDDYHHHYHHEEPVQVIKVISSSHNHGGWDNSGWNDGWNNGWNNGWNSGWNNGGWDSGYGGHGGSVVKVLKVHHVPSYGGWWNRK